MDIYREQLLDHYRQPRGWGLMETADVETSKVNATCGDEIRVQLQLEGERVTEMRFEGHGCVISRAAASLLSEEVAGKRLAQVLAMDMATIERLLGVKLSSGRTDCGLLALQAIQQALNRA